ncbi:MAG: DUF3147 family protein [Abditibacteriaceae bacterium]
MVLYILKVIISAIIIVAVTEIAKRNVFWGGILASIPLVSLLAFIWLYAETRDVNKIIGLSWSIFWLVLPSLTLFVALPVLLKMNIRFPAALGLSVIIMAVAYLAMAMILKQFGVNI